MLCLVDARDGFVGNEFPLACRHRWTGKYEAHLWDSTIIRKTKGAKGRTRGKQVYLGGYASEDEAAKAYDRAAISYWGDKAVLNVRRSEYHLSWYPGAAQHTSGKPCHPKIQESTRFCLFVLYYIQVLTLDTFVDSPRITSFRWRIIIRNCNTWGQWERKKLLLCFVEVAQVSLEGPPNIEE